MCNVYQATKERPIAEGEKVPADSEPSSHLSEGTDDGTMEPPRKARRAKSKAQKKVPEEPGRLVIARFRGESAQQKARSEASLVYSLILI